MLLNPVAISVINIKSESLMTSGAAQSKFSRKASWSPLLLAGLASRSAKYKNNKKYQVQARRLSWTAKSDKSMFSKSEIFNLKWPSTKQFFELSWKWVQNCDWAKSFFRYFFELLAFRDDQYSICWWKPFHWRCLLWSRFSCPEKAESFMSILVNLTFSGRVTSLLST